MANNNNNNSGNSSGGGITLAGMLGVAFIVLKLTHYIDWSWWLVTLPLWGPITLMFFIVLIAVLFSTPKY